MAGSATNTKKNHGFLMQVLAADILATEHFWHNNGQLIYQPMEVKGLI